jgi:hypothetical protein
MEYIQHGEVFSWIGSLSAPVHGSLRRCDDDGDDTKLGYREGQWSVNVSTENKQLLPNIALGEMAHVVKR